MTTVLITGANRGLGFGMAETFAARSGYEVIACCRNPEKADTLKECAEKTQSVEIEKLDVTNGDSIKSLKNQLGDRAIDLLINSAGIFGKSDPATTGFEDQMFGNSDFEQDWIDTFQTNVIGPMRMAETFVDNVEASQDKKIVILTSIVASITYAHGHMFGYAASKAAANMTARNLSIALRDRGVIVNPLHPGYAKTDMGGEGAHIEVSDAVAGCVAQIDGMVLDHSGEFLSFDGNTLPW